MIRINLQAPDHTSRNRHLRTSRRIAIAGGAVTLVATSLIVGSLYLRSRAPAQEPIAQAPSHQEPPRTVEVVLEEPTEEAKICKGAAKKAVEIYADGIARASQHTIEKALKRMQQMGNSTNNLEDLKACIEENGRLRLLISEYSSSRRIGTNDSSLLTQVGNAVLESRKPEARKRYGEGFIKAIENLEKDPPPENKDKKTSGWAYALFAGILLAGYAIIHMITNGKPEEQTEKIDTDKILERVDRKDRGSLEVLLRGIFDDLSLEQRDELAKVHYGLAYQKSLTEYLSLDDINNEKAEISLKRAKYFVQLQENIKTQIKELSERLADRLLAWAQREGLDHTFNYTRDKYVSAMLWDILKYCAHVDGAVIIGNQRKQIFTNIYDLQNADFIRDNSIDLSGPEPLTELELQIIIDNCYFDATPIGHGPEAILRQELAIQRMKQWFRNEQPM